MGIHVDLNFRFTVNIFGFLFGFYCSSGICNLDYVFTELLYS